MIHETFKFPAGEVHVKAMVGNSNLLYVPFKDNLSDHIMKILLVTNIVRRQGLRDIRLFLPYLPYSRQDRPTSAEEPFSLKAFGDILNLQEYTKVYTLDVHSDVAFGCVNNLVNIGIEQIIQHANHIDESTLVVPDQGAYKRLAKISSDFEHTVISIKERDTDTGRLTLKHVIGEVSGRSCLIVDDICDGGGTFIQLAARLYEMGAKSVSLFVTHGIFSKGLQPLADAGIEKIITTNSHKSEDDLKALVDPGRIYAPQGIWLDIIDVEEVLKRYVG